MIKITKNLEFGFFSFASRTAYYMLLELSSVLACHAIVDNFRFSGIRFYNCLCGLVCARDNIICNMAHMVITSSGPFIDVDLFSHRLRPSRTLWQLVRYICVFFVDNHGEKGKEGRSLTSKVK